MAACAISVMVVRGRERDAQVPEDRQVTVLDQIRRPVFSLLDTGPLSDRCGLLTYDDVREIAAKPDLTHMRDSILDDYQVFAQ
jgi:hypothetical protein